MAVNGILAQTIHTNTAKEFNLRFSLIITSMAVRDNIAEGDSYFIMEIKSLKRILDKVQDTTTKPLEVYLIRLFINFILELFNFLCG